MSIKTSVKTMVHVFQSSLHYNLRPCGYVIFNNKIMSLKFLLHDSYQLSHIVTYQSFKT